MDDSVCNSARRESSSYVLAEAHPLMTARARARAPQTGGIHMQLGCTELYSCMYSSCAILYPLQKPKPKGHVACT